MTIDADNGGMDSIITFPRTAAMPHKRENPRVDDFHQLRGHIVDGCAMIERAIVAMLYREEGSHKYADVRMQDKVAVLRKRIAAHKELTKRDRKTIQLLDELDPVIELRAILARSTLSMGQVDGQRVFILRPVADYSPTLDRRIVFTTEQLEHRKRRICELAHHFGQLAE